MERIKQALHRAREERAGAQPQSSSPGRTPSPKRSNEQAPAEEKIAYSRTRILDVPHEHLRRNRVIAGPDDPIAAYYGVLRTHVLQRMRANNWRSLAVSSPAQGAGKTLTSVNLAVSIARDVNHTVLLVDLDLRRPRLHTYFSQEALPGICDYLLDDTPLHDVMFNPGIERLVVVPGHESLTHSSETLSSPKMVNLVEDLKSRYPSRIIIFDMPPILACDDVLAFSPYFDAALLVVEEGETTREELKRSIALLEKTELLGTVLNKSRESQRGYGYGYGYN